jgi:hypothetical protein
MDVLQGRENGDHLVAAVGVQLHVQDRLAIQPLLAIHRLSHGTDSSKMVT